MITSWDIYWITRLDELNAFFGIIGAFLIMGGLLLHIPGAIDEWGERAKKKLKIGIAIGVVFCLVVSFLPTTKEVCAIYLIPKVANSEKIKGIGGKGLDLMEAKLSEWINDINEKENK